MKKDNIKLSIFWIFSFLVIIFMMTFSSHAATVDTSLPYVVSPSYTLTDDELTFISGVLQHFNFHSLDEPVIIFKEAEGWWYDYSNNVGCLQYRLYFPTVTQQALLPTNGWHDSKTFSNFVLYDSNCYFDVNFIDVPSMRITKRGINQNYNNAWEVAYGVDSSVWRRFYGTYEVRHENNISGEFDWVPNYPVYTNFSWGTSDGYTQDTFLTFFVPGNSVGSVSPSFENLSPIYDVGASIPGMVPPNLNLSSYNWTSKPALDFSTLEKAVESCSDLLEWLGDNISGSFSNLINNIQSTGNNITQTIQYYGNLIIANIQNGIQNFYDNMVGLVQPIFEKIDYITTPLEASVIWDNISTTSLVTNVNTIKTSLTSFQAAFTGVNEPSSYTIPIHLENLPSNWFGNQTTQYIDLGIINGTVKDGLRLFVWAMVTYGLVVTIFDSIANYINGGGDES